MEAAAIEVSKSADVWSVRRQEDEAPEVAPSHLKIKTNNLVNDIETQLVASTQATAALIDTRAHFRFTISGVASPTIRVRSVPLRYRRSVSDKPRDERGLWLGLRISALLLSLGSGWFAGSWYGDSDSSAELTSRAAINAVVERIITVESNGNPNERNGHSSATGLGQFLSTTWLDLIRQYRPDLTKGRTESETLELRRQTKLAREITTRFVEQNALMLRQRGLPVSAGTIYLAHFAGGAGAVAILSAPDSADAAHVLAGADATGRTKRDQIIKANPFLAHFTIADLKIWADSKMLGLDSPAIEVRAASLPPATANR